MDILTELDLTWVYFLWKIGRACGLLSVLTLVLFSICAICASETDNKKLAKIAFSILVFGIFAMPLFVSVALVSPDKDEVKAAAAYSLAKKVATSDKASELYDRLMKALEAKIGE